MAGSSQIPENRVAGSTQESSSPEVKRFSVYGDFWTQIQAAGVRQCPFFFEPILLAYYTLFFFILCPGTRKPVIDNLSVLFPESSQLSNTFRALRVFWSFSCSITDAAYSREGKNIIDWEVEGDDCFQAFAAKQEGAVVLTAHMGNYDVAAPMFSGKFGKKLITVRAPERDKQRQEYMQEKFRAEATEDYEVRYNSDDKFLGIDLTRAIMKGEYVAIQGDRILFDVSPLEVPVPDVPGFHINIPKGPFVLALTSRASILPLFAVRLGRRRYRVVILPEFVCERTSRDHEEAVRQAACQWVEILMPVVRKYWFQWYVFEPAFFKDEKEASRTLLTPDS